MTAYNDDLVLALEELPEGSLVLSTATGVVFRRTAHAAPSRFQWRKLSHTDEKELYLIPDALAVLAYKIIWDPRSPIDDPEDKELFDFAQELATRIPSLTENVQETLPQEVERKQFDESDYPAIMRAIEQKRTATLDCERKFDAEEDIPEEAWVGFGSISEEEIEAGVLPGNLETQAFTDSIQGVDKDKLLKKRIRTFVQPDGEIGVEISYFPLEPQNADDADAIFAKTELGSLISLSDFVAAIEAGDEWIEDCFGYTDVYELLFEVTAVGASPILGERFDTIFEAPLWIQRKGKKYHVYVFEHID